MKKKLYFLLIIIFITLIGIQRHNDNMEMQSAKQCFAERRVVMGALEMGGTGSLELYEKIMKDPEFGNNMYKDIKCKSGGIYSFIATKNGLALNCSKHGLIENPEANR